MPAFNQISMGLQVIRTVWYIYFLKRDVVVKSRVFLFALSPRTRTKWQLASVTRESFLRTVSCSSKAKWFQQWRTRLDEVYETYKTDLSEKRDFDNEILRWQTKMVSFNWWKNSETHRDTPARQSGPLSQRAWLQLLPSSWQYRGQLLPPNNRLARCGEWRRTYVPRWQQSNSQHTHWCRSRDSRILRQKEQKSSFQILFSSTKISFFFQLICR